MQVDMQLLVILKSILLGAGLSLCYDILRAFRWHFRLGRLGTAMCDMAFWILALAAFFRFGVASAVGQNRYYVPAGIALGAGTYMALVSSAVLGMLEFTLSGLGFLYKTWAGAVNNAMAHIRALKLPEKIRGFIKKVLPTPFHFWLKGYKINSRTVSLRRRQREWRR